MWNYLQTVWPDRKWFSDKKMHGKTIVITGGNTGIGKETVRDLAARGARIIIGCRDTAKGEEAAKEIATSGEEIIVRKLDLASFQSIRRFAKEVLEIEPQIHVLINNAGIAACPYWETEDGFEMQFGVNHLGHFLLTSLLVERLKKSAPARIVNVSSMAHYVGHIDFDDINMKKDYSTLGSYQRSKVANILFTKELAKKLEGTGVTTYCLHPGVIHTGLGRHLGDSLGSVQGHMYEFVSRLFFKNVKDGAKTTLYCTLDDDLATESGLYYSGCRKMTPSKQARCAIASKKLWELSEKFTNTKFNGITSDT